MAYPEPIYKESIFIGTEGLHRDGVKHRTATLLRYQVQSLLWRVAVRHAVPGLSSLVLQNPTTAATNLCAPRDGPKVDNTHRSTT